MHKVERLYSSSDNTSVRSRFWSNIYSSGDGLDGEEKTNEIKYGRRGTDLVELRRPPTYGWRI